MYNDALTQKIIEDQKLLKPAELKAALASAADKKVRLDEVVLAGMPEETFFRAAAEYFKAPFVDLKGVQVRKDILDLIPEPIAATHQIIAFDKGANVMKVATLDPNDLQTVEFLQRKTGLQLEMHLTTPTALREILKQYKRSLKAEFEDIAKGGEVAGGEDQEKLRELAQDLPVVRIVESLLEHAVFEGASDIHIEPTEQDVAVRYRVDGILRNVMTLPKNAQAGIVARIKVLSNLKLDEHRLPQDGRMKITGPGYKYSIRVSTLPVMDGEKIVMRLLSETAQALSLEQLGFNQIHLDLVKRNIMKPHGIIFVTGPTGSGKTTTLYSILSLRNTPGVNISTIEDPVEYRMIGVNQSQVNPKIGFTFATGLRTLLRQDPNIIMVGEIRDGETAEIATNAAMTGHLVFATLHTNDAVTAFPRLADMGVPRFLIAFTCNMIIAQRLVRKICKNCAEPYTLSKDQVKEISQLYDYEKIRKALVANGLGPDLPLDKVTFRRGAGCKQCNDEGYKGRVGIYEVVETTRTLQELINKNASSGEIQDAAESEGMVNLVTDGFAKAIAGVTSLEELMRVTKE